MARTAASGAGAGGSIGRATSIVSRFAGIGFTLTAIVAAGLGWFILNRLGGYLHDPKNADAIDPASVPSWVNALIDHPAVYPMLCLPTLLAGVLLLAGARPRGLWYAAALLGLLLVIGTLLMCFVSLVAPLYQYQEL